MKSGCLWTLSARSMVLAALVMTTGPLAATGYPGAKWPEAADLRTGEAGGQSFRISGRLSDAPACREFTKFMLASRGSELMKDGVRTDSAMVIRGGELVFDHYRAPYGPDTPHCLWSASKTVSTALLGALIARHPDRIGLDSRLATAFPATGRAGADLERYNQVTLRHLVEMSSGMDWMETYEAGVRDSSVTRMLYLAGFRDMTGQVLGTPMATGYAPGQKWNYSSGNTQALMAWIRRTFGDAAYDTLPWDLLFTPMGMDPKRVIFEKDKGGVYVGSSYVHMRLTDMARFGYLHLKDGVWEGGRRILPEGWVKESTLPNQAYRSPLTKITNPEMDGVFGRGWWLNVPVQDKPASGARQPAPYPKVAQDMYGAMGHYGQLIAVFPSMDLVFVRTGNDSGYSKTLYRMFELVEACFHCTSQPDHPACAP